MGSSQLVLAFPLAASNVGIALISAGAALLGALVGGLVTYIVERSRQKHERKLDEERQKHEQELEQKRFDQAEDARRKSDLDMARGLARVLSEELVLAAAHAQQETVRQK